MPSGQIPDFGVTAANDGSGRIFVVERAGRVRIVGKDGKVQAEPFIDLTNFNPLGSDVQTGFVEQGLWSIALHPKFKDNRDRLAALWAFAWFLEETAQHLNSGCSEFLQ